MKTALISIFTATLLGFAAHFGGNPFEPAEFISILFASALLGWMFKQYESRPRVLPASRPVYHLPIKRGLERLPNRREHLAA